MMMMMVANGDVSGNDDGDDDEQQTYRRTCRNVSKLQVSDLAICINVYRLLTYIWHSKPRPQKYTEKYTCAKIPESKRCSFVKKLAT